MNRQSRMIQGVVMFLVASTALALGQGGARHRHRQQGPSEGSGRHLTDEGFQSDRELVHFLLDHRQDIRRSVQLRDNGVETLTESDRPELVEALRRHVASMHTRLVEGRPIHQRDPLFRSIFAVADRITLEITPTEKGLRVIETSPDPEVVSLIQAHAKVVDRFLVVGRQEVRKDHAPGGP